MSRTKIPPRATQFRIIYGPTPEKSMWVVAWQIELLKQGRWERLPEAHPSISALEPARRVLLEVGLVEAQARMCHRRYDCTKCRQLHDSVVQPHTYELHKQHRKGEEYETHTDMELPL